MRKLLTQLAALFVATVVWVPLLHFFFDEPPDERALRSAQLALWEDPERRAETIDRMRGANAEWDFMGRTFLVLSLADRAIAEPENEARYLAVIDRVVEETLRLEEERGQTHFLMGYVHNGPFVDASGRSVFVDGEIAMMLAARQRVREDERWRAPLADRIALISAQMERGPAMSAESYPDECWTFCNTLALAAIRTSDSVTGDDHSALLRGWVEHARANLVDERTGLLVSSYTHGGRHLDGPEGSSIFLVAHALRVIDPAFAEDQYERARRELGASFVGFGWAREWPASWEGPSDIDSGPIVPVVGASAGASGMALLGAASFGDEEYLDRLHRSLALAAFPVHGEGELRYAASNQVGDAVLLYALSEGALWDSVGAPAAQTVARGGT
jgi:hypothetical protein